MGNLGEGDTQFLNFRNFSESLKLCQNKKLG